MQLPHALTTSLDKKALRQLIYTPIEEAIALLDARQKQSNLDIALDIPTLFQQPRTAVLARHIATPNHEMRRVVSLCEKHRLNLLILTYQDDKFSSSNECKFAFGRMGFYDGIGRKGGKKIRYSTIMNFNQYNGRPFHECKTIRGQSLIEFHLNLLLHEFPQLNRSNVADYSAWFSDHYSETGSFYPSYLQLFLKHAILFETFVLSNGELDFTLNKVVPAFHEIINNFGIKPLIVHAEAPEKEGDQYWQLYPDHLRPLAPYDPPQKTAIQAQSAYKSKLACRVYRPVLLQLMDLESVSES